MSTITVVRMDDKGFIFNRKMFPTLLSVTKWAEKILDKKIDFVNVKGY